MKYTHFCLVNDIMCVRCIVIGGVDGWKPHGINPGHHHTQLTLLCILRIGLCNINLRESKQYRITADFQTSSSALCKQRSPTTAVAEPH